MICMYTYIYIYIYHIYIYMICVYIYIYILFDLHFGDRVETMSLCFDRSGISRIRFSPFYETV